MADLRKIEQLFKMLIETDPPLPGNVSNQQNVCGKPGCRCKDENDPRPHGPHYQLSYSLNGKSSSLSVKPGDVDDALRMNGSYKKLRSLLIQLSAESVSLCREHGPSEARRQMLQAMNRVKSRTGGSSGREKPPLYLLRSRDNWKQKALQRQDRLEKNRIQIRDLKESRDKWRNEALQLRHENKELQQKQAAADRQISDLKDSADAYERNKKNV